MFIEGTRDLLVQHRSPCVEGKGTGSLPSASAQPGDGSPPRGTFSPGTAAYCCPGRSFGLSLESWVPRRAEQMQFPGNLQILGAGRRSPGGWMLFSAAVYCPLQLGLDELMGWSQLARPRMSTAGSSQARLLREEGGIPAHQAKL